MINVLIVEDDPMVAEINRLHVERISGFAFVGIANSSTNAMEMLNTQKVDLMLVFRVFLQKNTSTFLSRKNCWNSVLFMVL